MNSLFRRAYREFKKLLAIPGNAKARLFGVRMGKGSQVSWGARFIRARGAKIVLGRNCRISSGVLIAPYRHGSILFGDNCTVNPYCVIYGHGGLEIGNNVRIATHAVIIPANHIFDYSGDQVQSKGVSALGIAIEDDVWIGAGVRILDGVRVKRGSIIAAGAVVTRSLKVSGLYAGVPAVLKRSHFAKSESEAE